MAVYVNPSQPGSGQTTDVAVSMAFGPLAAPTGGGGADVQNPVDAVGITDSIQITKTIVRSPVDPIGITDPRNIGEGDVYQPAPDPIGILDSALRTRTVVRSFTDPVGILDSAPPTLGGADSYSPIDPVGITDTAPRTRTVVRSFTDVIGLTDPKTLTRTVVRSPVDPVGILDSAPPVKSGADTYNPTDNVGITDNAARTRSVVRSFADPIGITDASLGRSFDLIVNENIGIVDDAVPLKTGGGADTYSKNDPIGITDSAALTRTVVRSFTDTIGITDPRTIAESDAFQRVDNVGILDSATRMRAIARSISDPVGITEAVAKAHVVRPIDLIGITDFAVPGEAVEGQVNICIEFGAPRFVARSASLAFRSRTTTVILQPHTIGVPLFYGTHSASVVLRPHDASLAFAPHSPGPPLFRNRSATVEFAHGDPGDPTLVPCE